MEHVGRCVYNRPRETKLKCPYEMGVKLLIEKQGKGAMCKTEREGYSQKGSEDTKERTLHAPAFELNNHQNRADRANHDDKGPQELAYACPDIRPLKT